MRVSKRSKILLPIWVLSDIKMPGMDGLELLDEPPWAGLRLSGSSAICESDRSVKILPDMPLALALRH